VGSAHADLWEHLITAIPAGWTQRAPGLLGGVTGSAEATLNGVWVYDADGTGAAVSGLLDRVEGAGVPHCLQLSRASSGELQSVARARGMRREADVPLMTLADLRAAARTERPDLVINRLEPEHASIHAELAAAGFGEPADDFRRLMSPEVVGAPGVRAYVGEVGGKPVTTGIGVQLGDHVGIFNIATIPGYRRHGYGAAITGRALRDGLDAGAHWAWLQSTAAGYGVYERLGFTTLDVWECWIAT
jgi:ribosomal protein S18 acetylase RimI-like enzyme